MSTVEAAERYTLLIVDDDWSFRSTLAAAFKRRGWEVWTASNAVEALEICKQQQPERVILDLRMPDTSGLDLLSEILALDPHTSIVMLTGYGTIPTAIDATKRGAVNYLTKPAEPAAIESAFSGKTMTTELEETPSLDRVSWEHIQRVLTACDGNVSEAARRLQLHRRTLQRKLQKQPPRK